MLRKPEQRKRHEELNFTALLVEILEMDLLGVCLPIGLDAQVTVKGLVAFLVILLLIALCLQRALKQ